MRSLTRLGVPPRPLHSPGHRPSRAAVRACLLALAAFSCSITNTLRAANWFVDVSNCPGPGVGTIADPFCRIQDAIVAASHGDTITVLPGVYLENIDFLGKEIVVESRDGAAMTTIDGGGTGSVVTFRSRESIRTVLRGFTITNGRGLGAGIACLDGSSPSIDQDIVTRNAPDSGGLGGGIFCFASSPTISNTTISRNTAFLGGGGITCYNQSSPVIVDSLVAENASGLGGGINCSSSSAPDIRNTMLVGNSAVSGGGLFCSASSPRIVDVIVSGNAANLGGGLHAEGSVLTLANSTVCGNSGVNGGGFSSYASSPTIIGSLVSGNTATNGGACFFDRSSPVISHSTLTGNCANLGGAIEARVSTSVTVNNSIIYGNDPSTLTSTQVTYSTVSGGHVGQGNLSTDPAFPSGPSGTLTADATFDQANHRMLLVDANANWSPGAFAGFLVGLPQNLQLPVQLSIISNDSNTLFVWPDHRLGSWIRSGQGYRILDHRLTASSPCVDAGDPNLAPTGLDLGGSPRFLDGDLDGTLRTDMGAHEFGNVHLEITGNPTPGGQLVFEVSGTMGLPFLRIIGLVPSEVLYAPLGPIFVELSTSLVGIDLGIVPDLTTVPIPSVPSTPLDLFFQDIVLSPATGSGNTSNPVPITIR